MFAATQAHRQIEIEGTLAASILREALTRQRKMLRASFKHRHMRSEHDLPTLFRNDGILGNWLQALLQWTRESSLNVLKRLIDDISRNAMQGKGRLLQSSSTDCTAIITQKEGTTKGREGRAPLLSDRLCTKLSTARYFVFLSQGM